MSYRTILGIALIGIGVAALAFQGLRYTSRDPMVDMGPIHMTAERTHSIPLPPILGVIALVGGIAVVLVDRKKLLRLATPR